MANEEAKLFVAGLPDSISEDVLKQLFEATGGTVVNVSLPKDRTTGRSRGFGFLLLLGREGVDAGSVLGPDVVPLAHPLGRIMVLPEDLQQGLVGGLLRIVPHHHNLVMAGVA